MKTKCFKRFTSILLAFLIMTSLTIVANAESLVSSNASGEVEKLTWKEKIDDNLWGKIESADKNEKISVWLWFSDIDQEKVDKQVKKSTGLTAENLASSYKSVPKSLVNALEDVSENTDNSQQLKLISDKMKDYVKDTKSQRKLEQNRTNTYIKARRKTASNLYSEKNSALIKKLNLPQSEITFQSKLTPSAIAHLNKDEILNAAKSNDVVGINFYDDTEQAPPMSENQRLSMRSDFAKEEFGLTGKGINVLMNDHGCVRSDAEGYDSISNPDKIKVVVNGHIYPVTETEVMPGSNQDTHPNFVSATMQSFADGMNIFSAGYGCYEDVEWALLNCDIHFINGSINLGTFDSYSVDAPAKWFDGLISSNNVTLIASAGNSQSWQPYGWPNVISPSSGYNNISAGAYYADGNPENDTMLDYRYNPIVDNDRVCFKPDMVIAANSTSAASPSLSGILSMVLQLKPSLAANPELVKAILMASCQRKVKPADGTGSQENMLDGLTQRQGAGAVDAYRAISIVLQGNYGLGEITSGSTDINMVQQADGENINVSLAWLRDNTNESSNPDAGVTLGTLQELDLDVYNSDSEKMSESSRRNAGKQMVCFPADSNDGQYTIRVTKASQNTEPVKYAYAWSAEDTSGKNITFSTKNSNGILTAQEVNEQLAEAGVGYQGTYTPFFAEFDETVTGIEEYAFSGCADIRRLTLNNNITNIGNCAFYFCKNLQSAVLSNNLKTIPESLFYECDKLENVEIPESVTSIGSLAFALCSSLKNIKLPKNLTKIESAAFYNSNITSITIPNNVTTIGNSAFENCIKLESAVIGSNVKTIGERAFCGCTSLASVDFLPLTAPAIGNLAFSNLAKGAKGYVEPESTGFANSYDDLAIEQKTDMRTIYFTNNYNWENLKAYLWKDGKSQNNSWPGASMKYAYTNYLGQSVFSITFDYKKYDMIIFNGGNGQNQTVDIKVGSDSTGYYLTGTKTGNNWNVSSFKPDVRTIYFTNSFEKDNLKAYLWKDGTSQNNSWPGVPMTYVKMNYLGQDIYSITFDYNDYDMIIFNYNNGEYQTVDIEVGADGTGYYATGVIDHGKLLVDTYIYQ